MLWNIAAPFFRTADARWIDDAVLSDRHQFRKIVAAVESRSTGWHRRRGRATSVATWLSYVRAGRRAVAQADGVITVFPQMALAAALNRRLLRRQPPIVAWCFNIGRFPTGAKQRAARLALGSIERFVVHSTAEVRIVSDYLGLPEGRVRFVPLQRAPIVIEVIEERETPFCLAMGSANRDYATLLAAARMTRLPLVVVAAPRSLDGLSIPDNVIVRSGLTAHECRILAQRARFSIVPLADEGAASGQVTVVEAQRMARAVVATRSIGTVDYIEDGKTGVLVPPSDPPALAAVMTRLWDDAALRFNLGTNAARWADVTLSDQAAGRALIDVLDQVTAMRR